MNKRNIYIIGSGGFAKEVYFLLKQLDTYNIMGFIDYEKKLEYILLDDKKIDIIEEKEFLDEINDVDVCIGSGHPSNFMKFKDKYIRYNFPNIIHPSFIGDLNNINMGQGNIITAGVLFTTHISIGSFNVFNLNVTIGHDCNIGNCNVFNPSVNISGNCRIGNANLFGVSSVVLENKIIGNSNILGASSLLLKDIENNGVYVGSPAKFIKNL